MPMQESCNSVPIKIMAAVYAKRQFINWANIFILIGCHLLLPNIKKHTNYPSAHITRYYRAAQNRFASSAYNITKSPLTNTALRIPSPSIASYTTHRSCCEMHLQTTLHRRIIQATIIETDLYTERASTAMAIKNLQSVVLLTD